MQQLILLQDVEALGRRGGVVRVRDGYALNFLIPKQLAVRATADNLRRLDGLRKKYEADEKERAARARSTAERLQGVELTIPMKASDDGHLYGSVTVATLVQTLAGQGIEVEPRAVKLAEPIKQVGVYTVPIALHEDVRTEVKVWVVEEKEPSADATPPAASAESEPAETAEA